MRTLYKILSKESLNSSIKRITVQAPRIAQKALPGQFIILRIDEKGERLPLTIADTDKVSGCITLIFQEAGKSTTHLGSLNVGDEILDLCGPLGKPTEIEVFGNVVCIGGGVGNAVMLPIIKALYKAQNHVITITGARNKDLLVLENEMKYSSNEFYVTTDDGSYGIHGLVSDVLQKLIDEGRKIDRVYAMGPLPMMRAICNQTKKYNLKTIVSLDSIMLDGTGMCGACRVNINGKTMFTCVDGPEFDGHLVDWDELRARKMLFTDLESKSKEMFIQKKKEECVCQTL